MKNQIKSGAILSYVNLAVKTVAQLVYVPLLIRMLGQQEYGIYTLALGIASYLSILNLGINSSYIHFFTKAKEKNQPEAIKNLNATYMLLFSILGVAAVLVGFCLVFMLPGLFPKLTPEQIGDIRSMLLLLTVNVALSFPLSLFDSYIIAHERYTADRSFRLLFAVLSPVITIASLLIGGKAIAVVAVTVASNVLLHLVLALYAVLKLKFALKFSRGHRNVMRSILSFSLLIFLQIVAEQANWNVDKILLGRYQDPEAVAVYGTAAQVQSVYMSVALVINGLFTPRVHSLVEKRQYKQVDELFLKVGNIQFYIVALVMSGFVLFGKQFLTLWVGAEYTESYLIALLIMLPATIDLIQNTGIEIQRALGLQKDRAVVYLATAMFNLALSIPLCKKWGGIGCAVGTAISFTACNVLYMNWYYLKKMKLNICAFWKSIGTKAVAVLAAMALGYMLIRNRVIDNFLSLCVYVAVYCAIYAAFLFAINCLVKEKD